MNEKQTENQNNELIKLKQQNEQLIFFLERIQKVLPLYYNDLHLEIKNFLNKIEHND